MPASPRLSRRTALALAPAGALLVAGCGEAGAPGRPASADDPDSALVDEVVARITAAAELSGRVPALSAMHAAHLDALEADPAVPGRAPLATLRRTERELQAYLVEAALQAESGPLARLLASMSASVAQHMAVAFA